MPTRAAFEACFKGRAVPQALLALLEFESGVDYGSYSRGIALDASGDSGLECGWSSDPAFLNALIPFANASNSGSFYALWDKTGTEDLNHCPIIAFGDEGGEWVVARNVVELLQLASYDVEPMIDDSHILYFKSEKSHVPSPNHDKYVKWLATTFGVGPVAQVKPILQAAQAEFQTAFNEWKAPFLAHWFEG